MQPHCLFNALHAVSAQIHSDPSGANDTLVLVSDMLRHAVATTRVQEVRLRDELATLRLYTQIQQVRFAERLKLAWEIDEEVLDAAVPHLLLQPLVENAIKYGLETHSKAGRIVVSARREGDYLCLRVWNDGPGRPEKSPPRGAGIGLVNIRTRLVQLYGERQSFELTHVAGGGTTVAISMPFALVPHSDQEVRATSAMESPAGERLVTRAIAKERTGAHQIDTMPGA
jgi:LytS/YehU family sensor histidine kinase